MLSCRRARIRPYLGQRRPRSSASTCSGRVLLCMFGRVVGCSTAVAVPHQFARELKAPPLGRGGVDRVRCLFLGTVGSPVTRVLVTRVIFGLEIIWASVRSLRLGRTGVVGAELSLRTYSSSSLSSTCRCCAASRDPGRGAGSWPSADAPRFAPLGVGVVSLGFAGEALSWKSVKNAGEAS